jgi:hypothetical protein
MSGPHPNGDSTGAPAGNADAPKRLRAAGSRSPMLQAELLGRHTHQSSSGVAVHIWRRGTLYIARGSYGGRRFGETIGADEKQAEARLYMLLYEIGQGTYIVPSESKKRPLGPATPARLTSRQLADEFPARQATYRWRGHRQRLAEPPRPNDRVL